jgi:hypothetical protein
MVAGRQGRRGAGRECVRGRGDGGRKGGGWVGEGRMEGKDGGKAWREGSHGRMEVRNGLLTDL